MSDVVTRPYTSDDAQRDAVKGKRRLAASVLAMEAVVFWLAIIVAIVQEHVAKAAALSVGVVLALGCVLVAGMLRRPWAYRAGTVLQALGIACGFAVPLMFVLGVLFGVLWLVAVRMGDNAIRRANQWAARETAAGSPASPPNAAVK